MIEESVKRNLKEGYDDQSGETEETEGEYKLDCKRLTTAFFTALTYDESQYIVKEDHEKCAIMLKFQEDWFHQPFERAIYFLGGDSFVVHVQGNQITKIPIDTKRRGYLMRLILKEMIFSDDEIGEVLTRRG